VPVFHCVCVCLASEISFQSSDHTYTDAHTDTHIHTYTHTHTDIHTRIHIHAHTHTSPQAREELELSFMEHAELVFTTLSSTGRNVFGRLTRRHFDAVLIDEACQAAEVSTLQPLVHGTKKVGA